MQGKRSANGSLPDSINFDYGSTSTNMGIDQQICWNTLRDPAESRLSEYQTAPGGTDVIMGTISQDARSLRRWNTGETSSRNLQSVINRDERVSQNGWSPSATAAAGAGLRLEDQVYNPTSVNSRNGINLNLNGNQIASSTSFARASNIGSSSQHLDMNVGQLGRVGTDIMECSNSAKSGGLEQRLIPSSSGSTETFAASSGSGGFLVEEDDGRPDYSLDGHRISCKRKSIEGSAGQSSSSGSFFSREGSMWQAVPPHADAGNGSSSVSTRAGTSRGVSSPDPVNPRLRLSIGGVAQDSVYASNMGVVAETSRRNYRVRMNPTSEQDSLLNNSVLPRVSAGHSDVPAGHRSLRFVPANPPLDLNPQIQPENAAVQQGQSVVLRLPGLRRNIQNFRSSGASTSRTGSSSAPLVSEEGDAPLCEDLNSRPVPRNISEHPMFMPSVEVRNTSAHNPPAWNSNSGGLDTSRHVASSSRAAPGSGSQSSSGPTWGSHRHASSQYSRRLSEYVRRSLLSSAGSESGLSNGSTSAHGSTPSSQEAAVLSAGGTRGQNLPSSRSALRMDRHGDGVVGLPYSLRTLAVGGEGRNRLVSEQIRNVLDIMRRGGEGLRFEDVMILDPSVFFGMADIHDEHRDMRLDVDNMSYEELLALGDRIGNVSTGLSEEKILARLKQTKYLSVMREGQAEAEPCCVCQEEYKDGDGMGTLDCGHEFHSKCIKQWLSQKNSCPICKTTGLAA